MRQLFLDMDGVLADFVGHYRARHGTVVVRGREPADFGRNLRETDFFETMPPMRDALELWAGALRLHPVPVLLTGLPNPPGQSAARKRAWVDRHLGPHVAMIGCRPSEKATFARPGDVLVDDWPRHAGRWRRAGGVFVLHHSAALTLPVLCRLYAGD